MDDLMVGVHVCEGCGMECDEAEAEIMEYVCPECQGHLRPKTAEEIEEDKHRE
jgi:uncharacterized protein with PIN domain